MTRDLERLSSTRFDLLVVGGGIYGVAVAWDAALRGLSVALVERGDFGGGTSFNHLKTLHGGLRSLQSADLARYREGIRERSTMARLAPHLVRPLPFLLPTGGGLLRSKGVLRTAFAIDEALSMDRNRHLPPHLHLPAGRVVAREEAVTLAPALADTAATGGGLWYDFQVTRTERMTLAFAVAAWHAGACVANHVEAIEALREGRSVVGMRCRDEVTDATFDVRAAVTVNAAGALAGRLAGLLGVAVDWPVQQALNLVTTRPAGTVALGAPQHAGTLFLVPWEGRTVVGTWHAEREFDPASVATSESDVEAFLRDANAAFPWLRLERDEVTLVHRGLVPGVRARDGRLTMRAHGEIADHARDGVEGAVSIVGVKYTTGRGVAEKVVSLVAAKLGRAVAAPAGSRTPLPGAVEGAVDDAVARLMGARPGLEPAVANHLVRSYGSDALSLLGGVPAPMTEGSSSPTEPGKGDSALAPVSPGYPVLVAEVVHAVRHEMALTLADAAIRRLNLGSAGHPGDVVARAVAAVMAGELGWPRWRVDEEVDELRRFYRAQG